MSDSVTQQENAPIHGVNPSERAPSKEVLQDTYKSATRTCASLVHEINNPLAVSLLSAQLAARSLNASTPHTVRTCLERAIACIHAAANEARAHSHDSGARSESEYEFDVRDVIRFAALVTQPKAHKCGCALTQHLAAESCDVYTSPIRLETALAGTMHALAEYGAAAIDVSVCTWSDHVTIRIACKPRIGGQSSVMDENARQEVHEPTSLYALFDSHSLDTAFCTVSGAQCKCRRDHHSCVLSISFCRSRQ